MIEFTVTRTSTAPIETVFDVMTDHRGLSHVVWACRRSTLVREGTPAPNGVGAIRRLVTVGPPFIEEIIEYDRPTRWAYRMRSGAPTRDHVGTVDLRRTASGTEITWHLRAESKLPAVEWLLQPTSKAVIVVLLNACVATAERRAAEPSPSAGDK